MAADFTNATDYATSFATMSREEQLQYINNVNDQMRSLRRMVLDATTVEAMIDDSSATWTTPTRAAIKADIAAGTNGQTRSVKASAMAFYTALADIG